MKTNREKMLSNYRQADALRKKNEREAEEREKQRLQADTQRAMRAASYAEQRYQGIVRNTTTLPEDYISNVVSSMVFQMVRQMVEAPELHAVHDVVREFMDTVLIRTPTHNSFNRVEVFVDNDQQRPDAETTVTVRIPEYRLTKVLDKGLLKQITGKLGPVVMPDKPIYMAEMEDVRVSWKDPDDDAAPIRTRTI